MGDLVGLLSPMIDAAVGMHDVFVPLGLTLLAVSFLLAAFFGVYQWWLGDTGGAVARVVRAGIILAIPAMLLYGSNWKDTTATLAAFFGVGLTQPVLAKHNGGTPQSGVDAIGLTITQLMDSMFASTRAEDREAKAQEKEKARGIAAAIVSGLLQALFELLLMVLAAALSAALIFALFGPLLALNIGIIFGPLLIAWMPFGPMAHLAKSWLGFMLSQGLALVVGIVIALIAAATIGEVTTGMQAAAADGNTNIILAAMAQTGGFLASAAVILFVIVMLFKADDIAGAMVGGGNAGMAGVGGMLVSRVTRTTPGKGKLTPLPKPPPK